MECSWIGSVTPFGSGDSGSNPDKLQKNAMKENKYFFSHSGWMMQIRKLSIYSFYTRLIPACDYPGR